MIKMTTIEAVKVLEAIGCGGEVIKYSTMRDRTSRTSVHQLTQRIDPSRDANEVNLLYREGRQDWRGITLKNLLKKRLGVK